MHGSSLLVTTEPTGCNKVSNLPHQPRSDALHPVHPLGLRDARQALSAPCQLLRNVQTLGAFT